MIPQSHILGQDESLLVECQQGFKLLPEVCDAFKKMQQKAIKDGVDLQIVSSYRSFDRQLRIWQNKWAGNTPILDINEQVIDVTRLSDLEKTCSILTWSALPGASRHHWGTDLDVYDKTAVEQTKQKFQLVCSEYEGQGPCAKLNQWLGKYAQDFGFARPYHEYKGGIAAEPWHLSYQPLAEQIENQLSADVLKQALIDSNSEFPLSVIENIPMLFQCFVLNKGKP